MRLDRKGRVNAGLQVVTVGCSDDLCSPSWAARQYLIHGGIISEIPESNIHPIRDAGGVFTAEVMWDTEPEISIVREQLFREIGFLVEKKGATLVFITGHNPCAGCGTIGINVERQKQRLVEVAKSVTERFGVKSIVMFEEHAHGDHYEVLDTFESVEPLADAA